MANSILLEDLAIAQLIIQLDDNAGAESPQKLPRGLRSVLDTRFGDTEAKNSAADLSVGDQQGAAARVELAVGKLGELLRSGHKGIGALLLDDGEPGPGKFTAADRAGVYEAYGWVNGKLGDLESPATVVARARSAVAVSPSVMEAGRYPALLLTRTTNWLAVYDANVAVARGGSRQTIFEARDRAGEALAKVNSRVRHYYCSLSDEVDQTPLLKQVGMQPRRDRGTAQPDPKPEAPGEVTFDAATRTLQVAALPLHATSLRAYRQAAGGPVELAGVSSNGTVPVSAFSALVPGVTYTFWLAGHNSDGDGPISNKVTFTA